MPDGDVSSENEAKSEILGLGAMVMISRTGRTTRCYGLGSGEALAGAE